jgi:hypothetical protein
MGRDRYLCTKVLRNPECRRRKPGCEQWSRLRECCNWHGTERHGDWYGMERDNRYVTECNNQCGDGSRTVYDDNDGTGTGRERRLRRQYENHKGDGRECDDTGKAGIATTPGIGRDSNSKENTGTASRMLGWNDRAGLRRSGTMAMRLATPACLYKYLLLYFFFGSNTNIFYSILSWLEK